MCPIWKRMAGLLLDISPGLCPRKILRSSPASPRKTPSIPPLLLGLTQDTNKRMQSHCDVETQPTKATVHYADLGDIQQGKPLSGKQSL